jgi:phosphate transport system substrate-binding protein
MRPTRILALVAAFGLVASTTLLGAVSPTQAAGGREGSVAQRAAYAQIEGTGSTWSQIIVEEWISDVFGNGIKVVYTGGGSSKGRKDFAQRSVDFAISEIPYQGTDETGQADTSNDRAYAYLPIVAGGTAFTYQLKVGNTLVNNLRLSGETIAKIFTGQITNWNDAAITADNNGRSFPDKPIIPVVRADGSGTTAQFTTWLDKAYPSIWRPYFGKSGLTSYYPKRGNMIGQAGSDQVMNTISGFAGDGTIGYVEYSYPLNKGYPVVKVLNKSGYYVEPTQYNTAVALTQAQINQNRSDPTKYLTQILDKVYANPDPRAYPISSYSYMIIPTAANDPRMTTAKRQSLADFLFYSLCSGQGKAGDYGYSPLPLNLVQAGFQQIAQLKRADPAVDLNNRDVRSCNNPTFDGTNLNVNRLAQIAPQPPACDKQGEGPCGTATGQNNPNPDQPVDPDAPAGGGDTPDGPGTGTDPGSPGGTSTDPSAPGGTAPGGTAPGGTAPGSDVPGGGASPVIDPETGEVISSAETAITSGDAIYANSTTVSERPLDSTAFGWVSVLLLAALVVVPGLVATGMRRRRGGAS